MATLKDRLAGVAKSSAPNMNPAGVTPPPKKESEVLPDVREVIPSLAERNKLARLVETHIILGQQEREAKNAKAPITLIIKEILGHNDVGKCMVGQNRINYFNAPRKSISSKLLLEHGISPKIIEECTVVTDAYTLKITAPGSGDED